MLRSQAVTLQIRKPYAEAYDFLAEPRNFPRWGPVPDGGIEPVGGNDWLVELPAGRMVMRFRERNDYGVLDYWLFQPGDPPGQMTPVRLVPNGQGCELVVLWMQREGVDDAAFESEIDWLRTDLGVLKALLEGP